MSLLTFGHLRTTPLVVQGDVGLDDLLSAFRSMQYQRGNGPSEGFCGISLDADEIADGAPRVNRDLPGLPGRVQIGVEGAGSVEPVLARHLRDVENARLKAAVPEGLREGLSFDQRYDQRLVDVAVVGAPTGGGLLALVPTQNPDEVAQIRAAIGVAARKVDGEAVIGDGPRVSDDLFLWLLWSWFKGTPPLAPGLSLVHMRELRATSQTGPVTIARQGIMEDRIDVLGAVALGHAIGPMKLALEYAPLGLVADIQLALDGSFDVHRGSSVYRGAPVGSATFGVRSVVDVATKVLPELREAHRGDSGWTAGRKGAFRRWSSEEIMKILDP